MHARAQVKCGARDEQGREEKRGTNGASAPPYLASGAPSLRSQASGSLLGRPHSRRKPAHAHR